MKDLPFLSSLVSAVAPANQRPNMNQQEQSASLALGVGLLLGSVFGGGVGRLLALGAAAALVYRGATGHCPLYERLNVDTTTAHPSPPAGSSTDFTGV